MNQENTHYQHYRPLQRNTAEISDGLNPIDRKIAISLVFSITMIANTLKMPSPERRMLDTVMADEIRSALNTSSQTCSFLAN